MDYIKQYKSFVNSYYLSEGVRITAGLTLPAVLLSYFHNLSAGIIVSLGASCVIIVDNPGPIRDRRIAMLVCDLAIFLVALLTGIFNRSPVGLGIYVFLVCFCFSMIAVFGTRAGAIGLAALFAMVLNIESSHQGWEVLINALLVTAGGLWYTGLSLLLFSFRPYRLAKQALGECIQSTADYLRARAAFYQKQDNYDAAYLHLLEQQRSLNEKQNLVRELLFRSRNIVRESTHTGRVLVMIFLDTVDLFEEVMSSHQDYHALHAFFDDSGAMDRFREVILVLADELDDIGIAVKSGKPSTGAGTAARKIKELKTWFEGFRDTNRTAANVEGFISLRQILENIEDIGDRLQTLHQYSTYDTSLRKQQREQIDYERFLSEEGRNIDPKLLRDNISWQSNIFRHSMRVAIATLMGYIASDFFPSGHGYWILLTIIVILKPAYSLTKKRNYDRLIGTIGGALVGLLILYFVKNRDIIFVCMIVLMIGAYSFMRKRYLVFVILMTPYILLLFYLLKPTGFTSVIAERVIDTAIGSVIAFLANLFIVPAWEHEQFSEYLLRMQEGNTRYFASVANVLLGKPVSVTEYKLARKQAFVALANLSEAFNRMLQEPRNRQKKSGLIHQFVVLHHMLGSHIAALSAFTREAVQNYQPEIFSPVVASILQKMEEAKYTLVTENLQDSTATGKEGLRALNDKVNTLMEQRKSELEQGNLHTETRTKLSELKRVADQFNFIYKAAVDIDRICHGLRQLDEPALATAS